MTTFKRTFYGQAQFLPQLVSSSAWRNAMQTALAIGIGVGLPFFILVMLRLLGWDISSGLYLIVVTLLVMNACATVWEGVLALKRSDPPAQAASYPPASMIIAAYLPNEAKTLPTVLDAFLRLEYAAPLQIILAYNSPYDMAYEHELHQLAAQHPHFLPLRVAGSTSKAENVNAALSFCTGQFVGVFDADHIPDAGSVERAWDWIAGGYDVVQGRCLIRNGDESWIARTVAVEFENIYGLTHPGRARMHGFGIFGGSNGYWRTELLREIRMDKTMLTEDIDSSFRAIARGMRVASDPNLISRELAPVRLRSLLNQRLRWAQGWFQVTLKHAVPLLRAPHLNWQQKLGVFHLLIWRECMSWLSLLIIPLLLYFGWALGGLHQIDWFVPIFVLTTVVTTAATPIQVLIAYRLSSEQMRTRRSWFWWYLLLSLIFYSEYKNMIGRVAQIKEWVGERVWKTTARG